MTHDDFYFAHYFKWLANTIKNEFEQEYPEVAEFEVIESKSLINRQEEQAGFHPFPWQPYSDEDTTKSDDLDISVIRCVSFFDSIGMPPFDIKYYPGA